MKIPAFIKALAKFCDSESSRYALGGVKCESDGVTAKLTASDGRILATISYSDDHSKKMDVIVEGKALAAPPAAAFKAVRDGEQPHFDGECLKYGSTATNPPLIDGRFPRYEELFTIHDDASGYVAVRLDPVYLRTLCDLASVVGGESSKGITLFVKDAKSCVFGYARNLDTVARLAIMPLALDGKEGWEFPARPGAEVAAENPAAESVVEEEQTAPPPEFMDDKQVAAAVSEPDDWSVDLAPI